MNTVFCTTADFSNDYFIHEWSKYDKSELYFSVSSSISRKYVRIFQALNVK